MAAAAAKTLILVTGANSGVGFELAAQLMVKGTYHVLLGSRSPEKGSSALKELQSRSLPGSAEMLHLDVTKDDTIESAVKDVQHRHNKLDILVNNAAIATVDAPLRQQMQDSFNTNATGPHVLTAAFAPLLKLSAAPRIVNISSGAGSIGRRLDTSSPIFKLQEVQYRASKTALSMVTACQWAEYTPLGFKVSLYDPGYTISNLSPYNTAEKGARSAEESVRPLMDVIEGKRDEEELRLLHNTGSYPW